MFLFMQAAAEECVVLKYTFLSVGLTAMKWWNQNPVLQCCLQWKLSQFLEKSVREGVPVLIQCGQHTLEILCAVDSVKCSIQMQFYLSFHFPSPWRFILTPCPLEGNSKMKKKKGISKSRCQSDLFTVLPLEQAQRLERFKKKKNSIA